MAEIEIQASKMEKETSSRLFDLHSRSVVRISDYLGPIETFVGTGFFVQAENGNETSKGNKDCLVATTRHVADGDSAWVKTYDGKLHKASARLMDQKHEISIYALDWEEMEKSGTTCAALSISREKPAPGEPVLSMGAAGNWSDDKNFHYRWRFNEVSAERPGYIGGLIEGELKRRDFWNWPTWITSGFARHGDLQDRLVKGSDMTVPGYSGGPWINKNGQVVGITYGIKKNFFSHNNGLAESARFLAEDLDKLRAPKF